ncbi:MAG: YIP1 family protein [Fervidobacterium sp.]|nr:YIP1 family protein [Fervidobacterium sp.]
MIRNFSLILMLTIVHNLFSSLVFGVDSTFLTYTLSGNNNWKITQDAYLVSEVLFKDFDLYYPEDLFIKGSKLYVVDSGNARIVVFDMNTREIRIIGDMSLWQPTGIFVTDKYIYVADPGSSEVVIFTHDGEEIGRIGRPTNPLFGETANYKPRKLVVDKRGNLYIVSEGTFEGIIQLDKDGQFLGYFGSNTVSLTFLDKFIDLFYTKEQKAKLLNRIPKPYTNIEIDNKGLIYTITQKENGNAIKRHNTVGINVLSASREKRMIDEENFVDISVDQHGRMYALTETGLIYEYDQEGNLIFSFGGRAIATERSGLFSVAVAIEIDDEGRLYVLDKERGLVHVFVPTDYANILHKALNLYEQGKYLESKNLWKTVMTYDGYSKIAHHGLGKAYFQEANYGKAAFHFKEAFSKRDYSDAFWELRNMFLQKYMGSILLSILLVIAGFGVFNWLVKSGRVNIKLRIESKLLSDIVFMVNILKHPLDTFYYIQKKKHGSLLSASVVYLLFLLIVVIDYFGRSFIFNLNTQQRSIGFVILTATASVGLWIVSNWLVSSISDGKGTLRDIYIFTAYSFAPYILFQPFVILSTYILTYNEMFLVDFSSLIIITWSAVLLFTGVKEIHDYNIRNTIKSILLTLGWIFVMILIYSIVYMLWDQLVETMFSIVQEVLYRVRFSK